MKQSKHTPGEWEFEQCRGNNRYEHRVFSRNGGNYGSYVIAELGMQKEEKEPEEIKANAALIASAPALLEENKKLKDILTDVLAMCEYPYKEMNTYKAAQKLLTQTANSHE